MMEVSRRFFAFAAFGAIGLGAVASGAKADQPNQGVVRFHSQVEPLLEKYCYDCHGDGASKGNLALDDLNSDSAILSASDIWFKVLKNVRAGLMPKGDDPRPTSAEISVLENWIKFQAFGIDPKNPDPGLLTIRRLNRVEYRNTIRDLMGIDFNSEVEFPPDDTGHGFDNLGEVLTVSPLLLEKYLAAAEEVVEQAVPRVAKVPAKLALKPRDFVRDAPNETIAADEKPGARVGSLNARTGGRLSQSFILRTAGTYKLSLEATIASTFDFDRSRATLTLSIDGQEQKRAEVAWGGQNIHYDDERAWTAGEHRVTIELTPLVPAEAPAPQQVKIPEPSATSATTVVVSGKLDAPATSANAVEPPPKTSVVLRVVSTQLVGPMEPAKWIAPENYTRFFPRAQPPVGLAERDAYAREVLRNFVARAFRRPVEDAKIEQLVGLARSVYSGSDGRFEDGVARAFMAILASPRFIFRLEAPQPADAGARFPDVDEYALASRLSYFLWSSMPDAELFDLAGRHELRQHLPAQITRMLNSEKAAGLVHNFTGQWLQARDIESVPINGRAVLGIHGRGSNLANKADFDGTLRKAMHSETEMVFDYIMREDRSVLEFIDSDYTFLNARLAKHYGLPPVQGEALRLVKLPPDSTRGGFLTEGTVLAVTSNPTRTSPVKRGLFILDNFLGTPPPPPPPNIPALEDSLHGAGGKELPLREALAAHRDHPLCASCHARMDPLGFALENFNAMGNWRELDAEEPINAAGQLVTGESFHDIRDLKHIMTHERRLDYYRCLTEKMMTYALGRGLEYYDVETVDQIVAGLEANGGKFSVLLTGIINSAPFQKIRNPAPANASHPSSPLVSSLSPVRP